MVQRRAAAVFAICCVLIAAVMWSARRDRRIQAMTWVLVYATFHTAYYVKFGSGIRYLYPVVLMLSMYVAVAAGAAIRHSIRLEFAAHVLALAAVLTAGVAGVQAWRWGIAPAAAWVSAYYRILRRGTAHLRPREGRHVQRRHDRYFSGRRVVDLDGVMNDSARLRDGQCAPTCQRLDYLATTNDRVFLRRDDCAGSWQRRWRTVHRVVWPPAGATASCFIVLGVRLSVNVRAMRGTAVRAAHGRQHDPPPEPGNVDDRVAPLDGTIDGERGGPCGREEQVLAQVGRHRRVDKAGLDRDHGDAFVREPIPQSAEVRLDGRLGGAVDVRASPSAVAADRADNRDHAPLLRRESPGQELADRRHGGEIRQDRALHNPEIACRGLLVRENTVSEERVRQALQFGFSLFDNSFMAWQIVQIGDAECDALRTADAQVGRHGLKRRLVSADQKQRVAARRGNPAVLVGDP
jgi:hypothetical protein